MSILIKGMEMPTGDEMLCINIFPDGKVTTHLDLRCTPVATAIPVPPHGDLIDRDEVRGLLFIGEQCLYSWDEIEDKVDFCPTIIPAEEGEA